MSLIPKYDQEMRALAHQLVDQLFDHVQRVDSVPVVHWTPPSELRELVRLEQDPAGDASFPQLTSLLLRTSIQLHHPSYMGHQVCPPFPQAAIADLLISALNQSTAVWEMSPVATMVEKEVVDWLSARVGYSGEAAGTAVSGGSAANLTGLLAARARWMRTQGSAGKDPVLICSSDAHYSVGRAAAIMGIPVTQVIKVPTDVNHRIDLGELEATLAILAKRGTKPMAIVATSGSTATGSFDELEGIAGLRDRYDTWLHVDAAHGASVLLSERLRGLMRGIERADSLSWDPHKMLWMPLSLGVILVRDGNWLRAAFQADAPYLFHEHRASDNLGEMTIQCSRRADAIKLWLTLKTVGVAPLAAALEQVTETTRHLYHLVRSAVDFEPLHEPQFNIFCFRFRNGNLNDDQLDDLNQRIREEVIRGGEAWITSTVLKGHRVLRTTLINPRTSPQHVEQLLERIRGVANQTHGQAAHRSG